MKVRPLGQITDELEPLLFEMFIEHEMQVHEYIGIVYAWAMMHCPDAVEEYEEEQDV